MIGYKKFLHVVSIVVVVFVAVMSEAGGGKKIKDGDQLLMEYNRKSKSLMMLLGGMFLGGHAGRQVPIELYKQETRKILAHE